MLARREVLQKSLALGSLVLASDFSADALLFAFEEGEKQLPKPTPPNPLGPFYKRFTPVSNILRAPGDPGLPLALSGQVIDTRGEIVPDATIEIWQTNHQGLYDIEGYRYRGRQKVDKSGRTVLNPSSPDTMPTMPVSVSTFTISSRRPGTKRWSPSSTSPPIPPSRAILRRTTRAIR